MKLDSLLTDDAILTEIGSRVARARLDQNSTQVELANEAGIARETLQRLENGESTKLVALIRALRALGLVEQLDGLLPLSDLSPLQLAAQRQVHRRQRASSARSAATDAPAAWTWNVEP
jgi:transcriptional regulator with XRE-family HTH domain